MKILQYLLITPKKNFFKTLKMKKYKTVANVYVYQIAAFFSYYC